MYSSLPLRTVRIVAGFCMRPLGPLWVIFWFFNRLVVGLSISEIQFTWCPFWIQIHGLPLEKMTKANGEIISHKLGRLLRVEAHCEGLLLYRNFLRIRVEIDVTKPLPRGFHLARGVSSPVAGVPSWISFKYEKLSDFCFDCGRIGHE
ncbi:hypothetical protein ACSBR1_005131 [Camellia fascicularis]